MKHGSLGWVPSSETRPTSSSRSTFRTFRVAGRQQERCLGCRRADRGAPRTVAERFPISAFLPWLLAARLLTVMLGSTSLWALLLVHRVLGQSMIRFKPADISYVPVSIAGIGIVWQARNAFGKKNYCANQPFWRFVRVPGIETGHIEVALSQANLTPVSTLAEDIGCLQRFTDPAYWSRSSPRCGSLAIVSNPYRRLVSNICAMNRFTTAAMFAHDMGAYLTRHVGPLRRLKRRVPDSSIQMPTIKGSSYGAATAIETNTLVDGCRAVPQWWYYRTAEWLVPHDIAERAIEALATRQGLPRPTIPPLSTHNSSESQCIAHALSTSCIHVDDVRRVIDWDGASLHFLNEQWPRGWHTRMPGEREQWPRHDAELATELQPRTAYRRCPLDETRGHGVVWIYWAQGWDSAPAFSKAVLTAWRAHHPGWEIRALSAETVPQWLDLPSLYGNSLPANTTSWFSDILRTELIHKYGGLWADATLYPTAQINSTYITLDAPFFVLRMHSNRMTPMSSSLLVSACPSLLLSRFVTAMREQQPWANDTEWRTTQSFSKTYRPYRCARSSPCLLTCAL